MRSPLFATFAALVACGPPAPEPARNLPPVDLSTGRSTSCAVLDDGTIRCWGSDLRDPGVGVRGGLTPDLCIDQSDNPRFDVSPRDVPGIRDAVEVAVGDRHACARTKTGGVWCWGHGYNGQTGSGLSALSNVVEVKAGMAHTCARLATGKVSCWGTNQFGELGNGGGRDSATPVEVREIDDAEQLAVGMMHSCVVRASGEVWCWGSGAWGELGDGMESTQTGPLRVVGVTDAVEVGVGSSVSCARRRDGAVLCWGQLDQKAVLTPTELARGDDIVALTVAWKQMCIVRSSGASERIRFGDAGAKVEATALPFTDVVQLSPGQYHVCARNSAGQVDCIGANYCGALGDSTTQGRLDALGSPVKL